MNDHRNFDELARRKLDERSFPFEEAHWAGVQGSLNARRNGRHWWWLSAAALLFITATLWFNGREVSTPPITNATDKVNAPAERMSAKTQGHPQQEKREAQKEHITPATAANVGIPTVTSSPTASQLTSDQPSTGVSMAHHSSTTPDHRNRTHEKEKAPAHADGHKSEAVPSRIAAQLVTTGASVGAGKDLVIASNNAAGTESPASVPSAAPLVDAGSTSINNNEREEPGSINPTGIPMSRKLEGQESGSKGIDQAGKDPGTPSTNTNATVVGTSSAGLPSDSSGSAMPPVTQPAPKAVGKWSIEFSLLGGALNTRQGFTPATMLDDRSRAEGAAAPAAGAEAMWLKPHWGFGLGIHYTTLAERINSDRLESTATSIQYNYAVQSVETTLVVVTGSYVLDSVLHYTTTTKDTILHVLTIDRDTVTNTFQKRAARESRNTLSYWEVPLLLDAHTISGRFTFGVRGGPTVGFLQENHGSLPNTTEDGYRTLQRQQLRATVLGYQARAYVRYRICGALSVGLEPMVRGQFQSLFGEALPVSKAPALGAFFSVTYHLH